MPAGRTSTAPSPRSLRAGPGGIRAELLGIGDGGEHDVAGELRPGAGEGEAGEVAYRAASAVAADEPAGCVPVPAGPHEHAVRELTGRARAELGEDTFAAAYGKGRQLDAEAAVDAVDPDRLRR